jgi:hypothetical protein
VNESQTIKPINRKYREAGIVRQVKKIYILWFVFNFAELFEQSEYFISYFDIADSLSYSVCQYRFRVQGSRFRVQGSRFEVRGSGFKVQGSRFRVWGFASGFDPTRRVQRRLWPKKRPV